jgi:hypothetical protein
MSATEERQKDMKEEMEKQSAAVRHLHVAQLNGSNIGKSEDFHFTKDFREFLR